MNRALLSYRKLLRVIHTSFKGDKEMITKAMQNVRARYEASRDEVDAAVIDKKLEEAEEAASFIRDYVVQSVQNEAGNYKVKLTRQQVESMQETVTGMEHVDPDTIIVPNAKKR